MFLLITTDYIANAEYVGTGVQLYNAYEGDFNFISTLNMMFVDTILYLLLAWYFDLVLPQEYGTSLPFYFPLLPSYWLSDQCKPPSNYDDNNFEVTHSVNPTQGSADPEVEAFTPLELQNIKCKLHQLTKVYDSGKVAVRGLSVSMVENHITCLLGHNGAGK